jgi:SOS response regulatory protein OraA/RecX
VRSRLPSTLRLRTTCLGQKDFVHRAYTTREIVYLQLFDNPAEDKRPHFVFVQNYLNQNFREVVTGFPTFLDYNFFVKISLLWHNQNMFKKTWQKRKNLLADDEAEIVVDEAKAPQKTFDRAVNLLAYKGRTINELRERLLEKQWTNAAIVDEVIEKLKSYGYLNDDQFALNFSRSKLLGKPMGKRVLRQKLSLKKLDKETIEKALESAFEENSEADLIERAVQKRLRIKGKPETREDTKKFFDYLMRQGFNYDLIREALQKVAEIDED